MPNEQVGPNSYTFVENRIVQNWSSSTKYIKSQSWIFFKGVWCFSPLPSLSRKVAYMFYCVQSKNMKKNRLLLISVFYWFLFFIIQNRSWKSNCFINILLWNTMLQSSRLRWSQKSVTPQVKMFPKVSGRRLVLRICTLTSATPAAPRAHISPGVILLTAAHLQWLMLSCSSVCQQQVKLQADWRRPQGEFTIKADICLFYSRFIFTHIYIQHVDHRIIE